MLKFVIGCQKERDKARAWPEELRELAEGQRLLEREKFFFAKDFMLIDRVLGAYGSFEQILQRKVEIMEREFPNLRDKIGRQETTLDERISQLYLQPRKPRRCDTTGGGRTRVSDVFIDKKVSKTVFESWT